MTSTPEVMRHVQSVIKETTIPSWVRSVPRNFGEAKAGTLKADEWRTLATIYLPLALVSLWGEGSAHRSHEVKAHLWAVLDNTMALVSAICIACSRTMTHSCITAYRSCILTWLSTLPVALPAAKPIPNCHMACHIYDYLKLFGPVRLWWCFPFERLIGHLQHLPINHKFGTSLLIFSTVILTFQPGELEQTVLESFIQGSRLRHWLARPDCPTAIKECKVLFDKYITNSGVSSGDIFSDVAGRAKQAAPTDLQLLTSQKCMVLHARTDFGGIVFSRYSTHQGNSLIMFYPGGSQSSPPIPGRIKYIFKDNGRTQLAVQCQLPAGADAINPFECYPYFPARLYSAQVDEDLEVVHLQWVMCHYARWHLSEKYDVILPLLQVSIDTGHCTFYLHITTSKTLLQVLLFIVFFL